MKLSPASCVPSIAWKAQKKALRFAIQRSAAGMDSMLTRKPVKASMKSRRKFMTNDARPAVAHPAETATESAPIVQLKATSVSA